VKTTKIFLIFSMIATMLLLSCSCASKEDVFLKVVSYNVRGVDDGENRMISDRAPRLKEVVTKRDPDLIGFQEVKPAWEEHIIEDYGEVYDHLLIYRDERGSLKESSPVLWKKDKFEKIDGGIFWLSETPDEMSMGWDAKYYRICTWVKLKVKETDQKLMFCSVHLDTASEANTKGAEVLVDRLKEMGGFTEYPVVMVGDFNTQPWKGGYISLMESGLLGDVNADLDNDQTSTNDGYNRGVSGRIIEYCFYTLKRMRPLKYEVINEEVYGGYVSDHCGLYSEIQMK